MTLSEISMLKRNSIFEYNRFDFTDAIHNLPYMIKDCNIISVNGTQPIFDIQLSIVNKITITIVELSHNKLGIVFDINRMFDTFIHPHEVDVANKDCDNVINALKFLLKNPHLTYNGMTEYRDGIVHDMSSPPILYIIVIVFAIMIYLSL